MLWRNELYVFCFVETVKTVETILTNILSYPTFLRILFIILYLHASKIPTPKCKYQLNGVYIH